MKVSQNKTFSINVGLLAAGILVVAILLYITRNAMAVMSIPNALSIVSLLSLFLFLPDFFKGKREMVLLGMIVMLPLFGILLKDFSAVLCYVLIISGVLSTLFSLKNWKHFDFHYFFLSFLCALFLVLLIYSSSAQILSPVFLELIVNGKASPDTLFHAAISNSILYDQKVSTRIFGVFSFKYHWFSHYSFAGLSVWTNLKNISFYNWAYPIFVMPLFTKYLYILYSKTKEYFGFEKADNRFFFVGLLIYIIIFFGTGGFPSYLSSESLMLAHIFQFIFWILLLRYRNSIFSNFGISIFLFSLIVLILFTKASVGLLTFIVAAYLYLRYSKTISNFIFLSVSSIIFVLVCYYFFYTIRPNKPSTDLTQRLMNFTGNISSYFSYSVSLFYLVLFYLSQKGKHFFNFENFKNHRYIFEEIIFISILGSILFGLYFGSSKGDSLYFGSTFIFLNFIILALLIIKYFRNETDYSKINFINYGLMLICFIMTPQFLMIKHNSFNEKQMATNSNPLMKELVLNLLSDNSTSPTCYSIPKGENWFYGYQKFEKTTPFIMSGIGTIPAINYLPRNLFEAGDYSFPSYENAYEDLNNDEEIKRKAKLLGFEKIILFRSNNKKLKKTIMNIELK